MPVRFMVADRSHDAPIRALLRESSMAGGIALSLRTEPSYFDAAAADGGDHRTIVALDDGRLVCVGDIGVRERFIDGTPQRVAYLGRLRLARSHAGRFDVLRRGYGFFREAYASLDATVCFTSVADDNTRARRFFERGLRGMPEYRHAGDLVTCLFYPRIRYFCCTAERSGRVRRRLSGDGIELRHGTPAFRDDLVRLSEQNGPAYQFAPRWGRDELDRTIARHGLSDNHCRLLMRDGRPVGCAAVWDQRGFRQTVVAVYAPWVRRIRPARNVLTGLANRGVDLPPAGSTLSQAFVSHVCLPGSRPEWLVELILLLGASARTLRADLLAVGLDARDPRLPLLRERFRPIEYRTRVYVVHWPGASPTDPPDGRLMAPEIATL